MEFDVETFMSDVTAALAQGSVQPLEAQTVGEAGEGIRYDENLGEERFSNYEEFVHYPSDESITPPPRGTSRCQSLQSTQFPSPAAPNDDDEDADDFQAGTPAFFDIGMSDAIICGHPGANICSPCVLIFPDVDMSTALMASSFRETPTHSPGFVHIENGVSLETGLMSGERPDLVPSLYTYVVKACLLPIRKVQHELVTLYFQYIHPMFPVVDECYFMEIHRKYRGQEHFMDPSDFVIYQAITAAGFGVNRGSTSNVE